MVNRIPGRTEVAGGKDLPLKNHLNIELLNNLKEAPGDLWGAPSGTPMTGANDHHNHRPTIQESHLEIRDVVIELPGSLSRSENFLALQNYVFRNLSSTECYKVDMELRKVNVLRLLCSTGG